MVVRNVVTHTLDLDDGRNGHWTDGRRVRHGIVVFGLWVNFFGRRLAVDSMFFVADDGLSVFGAVPVKIRKMKD